jgi:Flp pilus assembly protein TadD
MDGISGRVVRKESPRNGAEGPRAYIAEAYYKQATALLTRGVYAESERYLREVLRIWPEHPGTLNNLGTAVWRQGRAEEAEAYYRRGLELKPDDFGILNNLGNAIWEQGRPGQAVPFYRQALALRPDSPETQMNLGVALSDVGEFEEALRWIRASLQGRPDWPEAIDNFGMTLARQGKWDEAMRCFEQALRLRPDFPESRRNRAYAWMAQGDFRRGWPEYEWRLRCRNYQGPAVNLPRWTGEDLAGRAILLHAEQGLGDTLQFLRFAPEVRRRGGRVILACPKPLVEIAARCPGVDHVQDAIFPLRECQVHSPLMSLPVVLGTSPASLAVDVPYLSAEAERIERWRPSVEGSVAQFESRKERHDNRPGRLLKIGIAWQGNPRNRVDRWRSFPLHHLAHLGEIPGICLISLQKGEGTEQIVELADRFPVAVLRDPAGGTEDRRSLLDTAAVMHHLDLVVTPDSAIAHLAGSLGVRVWLALPAVAEWRWMMDRDDSPWYPTMTLFRQSTPGDWDGVFRRMASNLGALGEGSPKGAGSC